MRNRYSIRLCGHCFEYVEAVIHLDHDYIDCSNCGKIFEFPISDKSDRMIGKQQRNQSLRGRAASFGSLSDIDYLEVARYVHNGKEKRPRKIIWEEMHKEYLQVQATKKAEVAAVGKCTCQEKLGNGYEELLSTQELVKLSGTTLEKSKKEKKLKHLTDNRSSTCTKAHGNELKRKSFSSKINNEVLESFYKEHAKRQHTTSETRECENDELKIIEENLKESEESITNNVEDYIDLINVDGGNDDHYRDDIAHYFNNEDVDL